MNFKLIRYLLWGFTGFLAIYFYINNKGIFETPATSTNIDTVKTHDKPLIGGPFKLIDQYGTVRKSGDFRGKYMLVYFGYAYCPDICPLGLQNITAALNKLKRDRAEIVPIFITVDPKRDDVASLKQYASNFHPNFVMLTGSEDAIESAKKAYKVIAQKSEDDSSSDYLMDHTTMVYLMDRGGNFLHFFSHDTAPDDMARGIEKFMFEEIKKS